MSEPRDTDGKLEQTEGRWRLRFVRHLLHSREKIWRALTEELHLATWFPTTIEGKLKPGAALTFRHRGSELPPMTGEMLAYDPPRLMEFIWGFSGDEKGRPDRSRFELAPEGEGSRLTFTTTYDQLGKSARDAAGWHVCFDSLENDLAGEKAGSSPDAWKQLNRHYTELFGPEAATIGPPDSMKEYHE